MIKHIQSAEEFENELKEGKVVVDFFATWCGPCRALTPELEDYAASHEDVKILKVDCDELSELASRFTVSSIPYVITFVDGVKTGENIGFLPQASLDKFLNSALR